MGAPTLHIGSTGSPFISGYPFVGTPGTKVADPAALSADGPAYGNTLAQTPDEAAVLMGHITTPYLTGWGWDGAAYGSKFVPGVVPSASAGTNGVHGVAVHPGGRFVAVVTGVTPFLEVYNYSPGAFGSKLSNPASLPSGTTCDAVAWSPDGRFLAVSIGGTSPYIQAYHFDATNGVIGAKVPDPASLPTDAVTCLSWSPDGRWLAFGQGLSPYAGCYEWPAGGGFGERLSNPGTLPTGVPHAVAWNPAGTLVAFAHATSPYVTVYPWGGGFGSKLSNPATLPAGTAWSVSFTPDGQYLAVAHETTPFVSAYPIHPSTGFGLKLPNPATLPATAGIGALFSSAGAMPGSTLANSYRLTSPTWEVAAQFRRAEYERTIHELLPVGHWPLDDLTGTTIYDWLRTANGTSSGSPTLGQAPLLESDEGYSILFDATNDYVACGDNHDFANTAAFSVAFLIRWTSDPTGTAMRIVDKSDATSGWSIRSTATTGTITFERRSVAGGGGIDTAVSASGMVVGVTYLVVCVYDGTNMTVYLNAVAGTPVASSRNLPGNALALTFGARSGGAAAFMGGRLQHVSIFDRALTADQVTELYTKAFAFGIDLRPYIGDALTIRRGLSEDGQPLVGQLTIALDNASGVFTQDDLPLRQEIERLGPSSYWPLDEVAGTTATDRMAAQNGTYTGGYQLGEPSLLASGVGRCVDLNGTTGYIPLTSSSYNFAGRRAFTILAVIRPDDVAAAQVLMDRIFTDGSGIQAWELSLYQGVLSFTRRLSGAGASTDTANGPVTLTAGRTYLVAATYDGSRITVYVDGIPGTAVTSTVSLATGTATPYIGRTNNAAANYFNGRIQHVALFDGVALSRAQLEQLYLKAITNNLYGLMQPYVPIRVRCTDPSTAVVHPVWRGQVMRYNHLFPEMKDAPSAELDCESRLGLLQRLRLSAALPFFATYDADSGIAVLLIAAGLRTIDYDLGSDDATSAMVTYPSYDRDVLSQISDAAKGGLTSIPNLFEAKDGRVRYIPRSGLGGVVGASDRWGDWSNVKPSMLSLDDRHDDRVSAVKWSPWWEKPTTVGIAWTLPTALVDIPIAPGGSITFEYNYDYDAAGGTAPVATTNYTAFTGTSGSGTDRTASISIQFENRHTGFKAVVSNTHATDGVYLNTLTIPSSFEQVLVDDSVTVVDPLADAGNATTPLLQVETPLCFRRWSVLAGARGGYADMLLLLKRYSIPRLTMEFAWDSDLIQTAMLRAELLDLITAEDGASLWATSIRDWWRIESIEQTFLPRGNKDGGVNRSVVTLRPSHASAIVDTLLTDDFYRASRAGTLGALP